MSHLLAEVLNGEANNFGKLIKNKSCHTNFIFFFEVTKLVGEGNAENPENPKHILAYSVVRQIPKG